MSPRETEAARWRTAAELALGRISKVMDFLLFATASLVRLTEIHEPDVYSHCVCCREPWPCQTMTVVKGLGDRFKTLSKEVNGE